MKQGEMEKAILRTLAYADVFNYPLNKEEVWCWLISNGKLKTQNLKLKTTTQKSKLVQYKNGFYFLRDREKIVILRRKKEQYSASKIKLAGKIAGILRLIPWVKLVGVTGALAMRNADKEDDIDLLIITTRNRLWLTRLLAVFLMELMGKRRRPDEKKVKDKICLNMFLDENHLALPRKERDLFSAHEVLQMKPLWQRGRTHQRFLRANRWSQEFLPNWKA
jgi:hypothetical protein